MTAQTMERAAPAAAAALDEAVPESALHDPRHIGHRRGAGNFRTHRNRAGGVQLDTDRGKTEAALPRGLAQGVSHRCCVRLGLTAGREAEA